MSTSTDTQAVVDFIADHYANRGEHERASAARNLPLIDAVALVLRDLTSADATAKWYDQEAEQATQRAKQAESALTLARQPLAPEMARLNARLTRVNEFLFSLRQAAQQGTSALFSALRNMPTLDVDDRAVRAPVVKLPISRPQALALVEFFGERDTVAMLFDAGHGLQVGWPGERSDAGRPLRRDTGDGGADVHA